MEPVMNPVFAIDFLVGCVFGGCFAFFAFATLIGLFLEFNRNRKQ